MIFENKEDLKHMENLFYFVKKSKIADMTGDQILAMSESIQYVYEQFKKAKESDNADK